MKLEVLIILCPSPRPMYIFLTKDTVRYIVDEKRIHDTNLSVMLILYK